MEIPVQLSMNPVPPPPLVSDMKSFEANRQERMSWWRRRESSGLDDDNVVVEEGTCIYLALLKLPLSPTSFPKWYILALSRLV